MTILSFALLVVLIVVGLDIFLSRSRGVTYMQILTFATLVSAFMVSIFGYRGVW